MALTVEVKGLPEILAKLTSDQLYGFDTRLAVQKSLEAVQIRGKVLVPKDTRNLMESIKTRMEPSPTGLLGTVYSDSPYALAVHEGRRRGAKMPPPSALEGWLGRHGLDVRLAFVIARAIGRRGIPPRPFLRQALEDSRGAIDRNLSEAAKAIERRWSAR